MGNMQWADLPNGKYSECNIFCMFFILIPRTYKKHAAAYSWIPSLLLLVEEMVLLLGMGGYI
jgi:hypothetical protein